MSNVTVTFDAEPHHILEVDGESYHGGEEFSIASERVAELVAQRVPLRYDPDALSRDALESIAEASGVDPADHKTKADLAAALTSSVPQPPDHTPTAVGVPTSPGSPATASSQTTPSSANPESEED